MCGGGKFLWCAVPQSRARPRQQGEEGNECVGVVFKGWEEAGVGPCPNTHACTHRWMLAFHQRTIPEKVLGGQRHRAVAIVHQFT